MQRTQLTTDDKLLTADHYTIAGMRVAMHDGDDLHYFANDYLSSAALVMDASGTAVSAPR